MAMAALASNPMSAISRSASITSSRSSAFLRGHASVPCLGKTSRPLDQGPRRLVVEARRRRSLADGYGRQQQMPMPKVDVDGDDAPKFVIFVKTKNVNLWYPLSMVSGGSTAKLMVSAMKWDLGKRLYEGTLTRNMAAVIYKDETAIQQTAMKQYPMIKGATGYEYGYKLVDPKNPQAALSASGVIRVPAKEEMKSVLDKAKEFVDGGLSSLRQQLPSFGQKQSESEGPGKK